MVFFIIMMVGFCVFMAGIVLSNIAVYRMMKVVDQDLDPAERIAPWRVLGKGAAFYKPAERYRAKHGDGPLNRQLSVGYWLCGIGGVMLLGPALIAKVH